MTGTRRETVNWENLKIALCPKHNVRTAFRAVAGQVVVLRRLKSGAEVYPTLPKQRCFHFIERMLEPSGKQPVPGLQVKCP